MAKKITGGPTDKREELEKALQELLNLPPDVKDYTYDQAIALTKLALELDPDSSEFKEYLRLFHAKNNGSLNP